MIKHYPFKELGKENLNWLSTHYHFSFANYYNPERMGLGNLRVINDDSVKPHTGFDTHYHRDMEIITFVRSGAVTHEDNKGHGGEVTAGQVQVMSAGTGIMHSEFNLTDGELKFYQIWIKPNEKGLTPRWKTNALDISKSYNQFQLIVSGHKNHPLWINQDVLISYAEYDAGLIVEKGIRDKAYLLVSEGEITIGSIHAKAGDGVQFEEETNLKFTTQSKVKLLLIEV